MRDLNESPVIYEKDLTLKSALEKMGEGKLGFVMVLGEQNKLNGIIGNADLRKGLLKHIDNLNQLNLNEIINRTPITVGNTFSVFQLLRFIKKESRPILYLPVVNDNGEAVGSVNFLNLIKGEL